MVSVSTCFNYELTFEEQIKMIREVGFKCFSTSGRYPHNGLLDNTEGFIAEVLASGLSVDTIHGCRLDIEEAITILDKCCFAAKCVGASIVVVHPSAFYISEDTVEDKFERIMAISEELILLAKKYNIKFAVENLHPDSATDLLKKLLDTLDSEYFGLCYDITHAQVDGPRECTLLDLYGDRIIAVHISDRIKEFVDHVVPGEGFIDFKPLEIKLAQINYEGTILMEVLSDFTQFKNPKILLEKAYEAGEELDRNVAGFQPNFS